MVCIRLGVTACYILRLYGRRSMPVRHDMDPWGSIQLRTVARDAGHVTAMSLLDLTIFARSILLIVLDYYNLRLV